MRALVIIVLAALVLVVGTALVVRLVPTLTPTGCTITAATGPDVDLDPDQAANASTIQRGCACCRAMRRTGTAC